MGKGRDTPHEAKMHQIEVPMDTTDQLSEDDDDQDNQDNHQEDIQPAVMHSTSSASDKKKLMHMLPTKDEQIALRETETLMRCNLLRLQCDEMLDEVRHLTKLKRFESFLADFKVLATGLKEQQVVEKYFTENGLYAIQLQNRHTKPVVLDFKPPVLIQKIGSYALDLCTAPYVNMDVCVSMPDACFDPRDILNHVYFDKRKLYLSVLLVNLKSSNLVDSHLISLALFKGDERKPIIHIADKMKKYSIRIHLTANMSVFKYSQLRPSKNNVRPLWWIAALKTRTSNSATNVSTNKRKIGTDEVDGSALPATPSYNNAVLEDLSMLPAHSLLHDFLRVCPTAANTILLFKVWLTQIAQRYSIDGLDSHSATLLIAYLYQIRLISPQVHCITAMQSALKFILDSDFPHTTMDFLAAKPSLDSNTDMNALTVATLLIPLTTDASVNALWRLSSSSLRCLKHYAKSALSMLQSGSETAFTEIFMKKRDFFTEYAFYLHIPVVDTHTFLAKDEYSTPSCLSINYDICADLLDLTPVSCVLLKASEVLQRAFGDRCSALHTIARCNSNMESSSHFPVLPLVSLPSESCIWSVTVGVILNQEHAYRRVDKGPSSDDVEALELFRSFWGEKSQLRRFKDGVIVDAIVWSKVGYGLIEELTRYITGRHLSAHCGATGDKVRCVNAQLEVLLPANSVNSDGISTTDSVSLVRSAVSQFDQLRRLLTSTVKDLPLAIDSLSAASPLLRFTSLFPPTPNPLIDPSRDSLHGQRVSRIIEPILLVGTFVSSGRWPAELVALRKSKQAIFIRLSEILNKKFKLVSIVHDNCIDVSFAKYVFRIFFNIPQELLLLQQNSKYHREMLLYYNDYTMSVVHHTLVHGLQSRFHTYSTVVRLVCLWLDKHCLSNHFSIECIELLVASVYNDNSIQHSDSDRPLSSMLGFLKTLQKLIEFDWQNSSLIVSLLHDDGNISNLNRSQHIITNDAIVQINKDFDICRSRSGMNNSAMYIISNTTKDAQGNYTPMYTQSKPENVVLKLAISAAKVSVEHLVQWMSSSSDTKTIPESIFESSVVANMANITFTFPKKLSVAHGGGNDQGGGNAMWKAYLNGPTAANIKLFSNLSSEELSPANAVLLLQPSPHPIQSEAVTTITEHFDHLALFFWDRTVAKEMYLIWRPKVLMSQNFSLLQSRYSLCLGTTSSVPSSNSETKKGTENLVILNVVEVVSEVIAAGGGLLELVSIR